MMTFVVSVFFFFVNLFLFNPFLLICSSWLLLSLNCLRFLSNFYISTQKRLLRLFLCNFTFVAFSTNYEYFLPSSTNSSHTVCSR